MAVKLSSSDPIIEIHERLLSWDLSPVSGESLSIKHHRYAHIALTITKSEDAFDQIDWSKVHGIIPPDYPDPADAVEDVLNQFAEHIRTIRKEPLFFKFEITDISYHPVDYRITAYELVTCFALVRCFDKSQFEFDPHRIFRIK